MVSKIAFNLGESKRFLQNTGKPVEQKEEMNKLLEDHCASLGFTVGVRNIMDMDETEFAKARNNTFGASDSSVLLGVAYSSKSVKMKTPDELLYEKVNNVWNEDIGKLASVRKGKELEDMIIHKLETILDNIHILKPSHMYINQKGLATNFDGVAFEIIEQENNLQIYRPIPFEIKLCSFFGRNNYAWCKGISEFSENIELKLPMDLEVDTALPIATYIQNKADWFGIPKYYYTQLQQQMEFLDAPYGYLGVMDDINWEVYIFAVPRDQHVIDKLNEISYYQYLRLCKQKGLPLPKVK